MAQVTNKVNAVVRGDLLVKVTGLLQRSIEAYASGYDNAAYVYQARAYCLYEFLEGHTSLELPSFHAMTEGAITNHIETSGCPYAKLMNYGQAMRDLQDKLQDDYYKR